VSSTVRLWPILLLVLINALWGSSYVVAKIALEEIPPPLLAALRFTLAVPVLWLLLSRRARRSLPPRADALRLGVLGLVGISINAVLIFWGVSLTTAADAALLIVGEVLFTTLLAILIAGDRLSPPRRAGLVIGLAGVVLLVGGGATQAAARPLGDVLILAGLAFEAAFTVFGTRLTQRYDPLTVLTLSVSGSCLVWLPLMAGYAMRGGLSMPSPQAGAGVVYLGLVNTVVCYLVWFSVLRRAGAALGALSLLAQPLVGAVLGIVVLGDELTGSTLLGGACVLACLVLAAFGSQSGAISLAVE
jgi:drug/metabolite transporter (DMT)-like permease